MKVKFNCKKIIKTILIAIFIILIFCFIIYFIKINMFYYKKEDRSKKLTEFNNSIAEATSWIRVQGTNIDFPIVSAYSSYDISDPSRDIGWTYNDPKEKNNRITVYSHNMRNISSHPLIADKNQARFEHLMSFVYYDFAKKNKYIQYTANGKNELYKIYAVYFADKDEFIDGDYDLDKTELNKYIKYGLKNSIYNYDVNISKKDDIITLVTCTRFINNSANYSFVVDAKKVTKNEFINNYKVNKNKNYKKIDTILEGDE